MQTSPISPSTSASGMIEWAPFALAAGATPAELLQTAERMQADFLSRQPGFLRRELLQDADGGWVDLILWRDAAAFEAAMAVAGAHPACQAFFALLTLSGTPSTGGMRCFSRVRRWDDPGL